MSHLVAIAVAVLLLTASPRALGLGLPSQHFRLNERPCRGIQRHRDYFPDVPAAPLPLACAAADSSARACRVTRGKLHQSITPSYQLFQHACPRGWGCPVRLQRSQGEGGSQGRMGDLSTFRVTGGFHAIGWSSSFVLWNLKSRTQFYHSRGTCEGTSKKTGGDCTRGSGQDRRR